MTPPSSSRERGSAAVEFVMVSILVVALVLAVIQVAVYLHARNVMAASYESTANRVRDRGLRSCFPPIGYS